MEPESRPIPLLGDIPLEYGQAIEHALDAGFVSLPIVGLEGELQQRLSRRSHRIRISGYLVGEDAAEKLKTLQQAAAKGEALTFSADITRALDLQQVVITSFRAAESAGQPNVFRYDIEIAESPPLPPPAQVDPLGGLGDFGLGDLGFDEGLLGDVQDLAGEVAGAVDDALNVIDQLGALANLDGLSVGGILEPLSTSTDTVRDIGTGLASAAGSLRSIFFD